MSKSDDLIDQILKSAPSPGTLFLVLSKMKDQGKVADVIRHCISALNLYSGDIRLRQLLAECYQELGFIGQAEEELAHAASEIDRLAPVYKALGRIYCAQGRLDEAGPMLRRYLAHYPEDQEALDLMASVKTPEKEPLPEGPGEELATPTLAEIYYGQGRIDEAIATYRKVLQLNPDDTSSRNRLAELETQVSEKERLAAEAEALKLRTEKTVAILEGWLIRLQDLGHVS